LPRDVQADLVWPAPTASQHPELIDRLGVCLPAMSAGIAKSALNVRIQFQPG